MKKTVIYILSCLLLSLNVSLAQTDTNEVEIMHRNSILMEKNPVGTEYYITFLKNYRQLPDKDNKLTMKLFITALSDANVVIEVPQANFRRELFIPANETKFYSMPDEAQLIAYNQIESGKAIHITSDMPIYVYGLSTRTQTTDSYLAFPTSVLGKEYRVMNYCATSRVITSESSKPEFSIIAVENDTRVRIIPSCDLIDGTAKNDTLTIKMNQGDTYQTTVKSVQKISDAYPDLTGTHVSANKPIAVFSGHECAFVPLPSPYRKTCNHLIEQVPPISSWGKHFCLGKLAKRSTYVYRILADEDSTIIFIDNQKMFMLMAGQYVENRIDKDITISADKPLLVAQYAEGYGNGDNIGDPMMLYVSPTKQFLQKYFFSTPNDGSWYHYINIVVQTKAINSVRIDGKTLEIGTLKTDSLESKPVRLIDTDPQDYIKNLSKEENSKFRKLGTSRYSIGTFAVAYGPHEITCSRPFGMYSYGFGNDFDAYGTMGGQAFKEYVYVADSNPPYIEKNSDAQSLDIILYDDRDNDSGLLNISSSEEDNISFSPLQVTAGIPYHIITIKPISPELSGKAYLVAEDMEGNIAEYTICYTYNSAAAKYVFELQDGIQEFCSQRRYELGAFICPEIQTHNTNFSEAGSINAPSNFSDALSTTMGAGIYFSMKMKSNLRLSMKLFVNNVYAELSAAYPEVVEIRNPDTGKIEYLSEAQKLKMDALFLNYNAEIEYYLDRRIYLKGGLGLAVNISEDSRLSRYVIDPGYDYLDSEILSGNTNAINPLRFYATGGIGFSQTLPIMNEYVSVFTELLYSYNFNNYIKKNDWQMNIITLNIGAKYSF